MSQYVSDKNLSNFEHAENVVLISEDLHELSFTSIVRTTVQDGFSAF